MSDSSKHSFLDMLIGASVAFIISLVIYFYNYPSNPENSNVVKTVETTQVKTTNSHDDVIHETVFTRVNAKSFCKFGYQFISTILGNPSYAVSISTIQVMEKINGASVPMKCTEQ
jgi:hypothetical protein